jgi:hypothetical protein
MEVIDIPKYPSEEFHSICADKLPSAEGSMTQPPSSLVLRNQDDALLKLADSAAGGSSLNVHREKVLTVQ